MKKIDLLLSDYSGNLNKKKWNYYQEWNNAIFLHFKIPYNILNPLIPKGLELDSFNNNYYVSLVAFTMNELHPKNLFPIGFISDFHEINIRTYVKKNNHHGVYFLNIEAEKKISAYIARILSKLPYEASQIKRENNSYISYNYSKKFELKIRYNLQKTKVLKTDLDIWLLERYCLFYVDNLKIYRFDIYHKEWPLQKIDLVELKINYQFNDLILNTDNIEGFHYSNGVSVLSWPKVDVSD